jgi:perosamine synthetase
MELELNQDFQREVFFFMKSATSWITNATRAIEVDDEGVSLVPVSGYHLDDQSLIESFARWRSQHQYAYPSRFRVTQDGTKSWLELQVLGNLDRLLFLVVDRAGNAIGHAGLLLTPAVSEVEMDNILRGESTHPGAMSRAMAALEEWAYRELGIDTCKLRVLKSNDHARIFCEHLDYQVESEAPLKRFEVADGSSNLMPDDGRGAEADDHFLIMVKSVTDSRPPSQNILTAGPSIGPRERAYCADAVAVGWNDKHSEYLNRLEEEFAAYIGTEFAIATSSCTGALHLSLLALGVGPGDEVIVPEITWVATASAVAYVGATPIFCDVDPESWCISPAQLRALITPRTKAVIPVHLYGFPADMSTIMATCREFNIHVVEDAAPAIGAKSGTTTVGSFGEFGCFSFQGAKVLVTGEGGMLVTSNRDLYGRAKKIQDHGRKPGTFWIEEVGRKYKMSNQTAALGLAQLERAELQIARKAEIAGWYQEFLGDCRSLTMQHAPEDSRSVYWMNSIRIREDSIVTRDELMDRLAVSGIDTRPVFTTISSYPIWGRTHAPAPVASAIGASSINLPSGVLLSRSSVRRVCNEIKSALGT